MKAMTMTTRMFSLGTAALVLFLVSAQAFAAEEATQSERDLQTQRAGQSQPGTQSQRTGQPQLGSQAQRADQAKEALHDGKVVSVTGNNLKMTDKQGKQHSFMLPTSVQVSLDGKQCKAQDLKAGTKIRVTSIASDAMAATHVEGIEKNAMFANTHAGKVVSISGDTLKMTGKDGKEHSHTLSDNAQVTLDGKPCKPQDLKKDMDIQVTTKRNDEKIAIMIEAVNKDSKVAQRL